MSSLVLKVLALKKAGLSGHSVMYDWLRRWIQSLQRRVSAGYDYLGAEDLSRLAKDSLSDVEALEAIGRVFETMPRPIQSIPGFSAANPPPVVSLLTRVIFSPSSGAVTNFVFCLQHYFVMYYFDLPLPAVSGLSFPFFLLLLCHLCRTYRLILQSRMLTRYLLQPKRRKPSGLSPRVLQTLLFLKGWSRALLGRKNCPPSLRLQRGGEPS